ncbi:MAG: sensor histidine kinase [Deltaproteobacteria bacterium]|nr:MAG: sensor histidine kinase [Deltaproteobacteria bacterium]
MAAGIPWWRSFEAKVLALVALVSLACIGSAAYLLRLSTTYLDARIEASLVRAEDMADVVRPFYRDQMQALASAYRARARALAMQARAEDWGDGEWEAAVGAEPDLVSATVRRAGAARTYGQGSVADEEVTFEATWPEDEPPQTAEVVAVFRVDPEYDRRFQEVGRMRRALAVERRQIDAYEAAVVRAVSILVAVVLVVAMGLGVVLARTVTRRVAVLAATMARIEQGEENIDVPDLGRDEVGRLGEALRTMLDALARARERVAYLERIGAWQGMARRIAHEIKNPLTPITLAVQQLRDKDPGTDPAFSRTLATAVEIVEDEVGTLRRMVATFSRFAKMPEVAAAPEPVDRILEEFERAYGHLTDDEADRLEIRPSGRGTWVLADRALLKQVLVNLVENAVQAAREVGTDGVFVRIAVEDDPDRGFVRIVVDDNGPGIPAERRRLVFEPYHTGRRDGTGLGLAIVKKILLDHGGDVWVEDAPLGGARFVVRLRRAEPAASGTAGVGHAESSSSSGER